MFAIVVERRAKPWFDAVPLRAVVRFETPQRAPAIGVAESGEPGAAHRAVDDRQARAPLQAHYQRPFGLTDFEIDHLVTIRDAERHAASGLVGQSLHQGPRQFDDAGRRKVAIAEHQYARTELVLLGDRVVAQVAEPQQRVGESRNRGARQPGPTGQLGIAQPFSAWPESAQQVEPASQRNDQAIVASGARALLTSASKVSGNPRHRSDPEFRRTELIYS